MIMKFYMCLQLLSCGGCLVAVSLTSALRWAALRFLSSVAKLRQSYAGLHSLGNCRLPLDSLDLDVRSFLRIPFLSFYFVAETSY